MTTRRTRKYQILVASATGIGLSVMFFGEPMVPGKVRAFFGAMALMVVAFDAGVQIAELRRERAGKG